METCGKLIKEKFPLINDDIFNYIADILTLSRDDFNSTDELYEAVGEMLLEVASDGTTEDDVMNVCSEIYDTLGMSSNTKDGLIKKLEAPVQMSSLTAVTDKDLVFLQNSTNDLLLTQVDAKKLQKAEQKLLQKQEKRETRENSAGPRVPTGRDCQASAAQVISKKERNIDSTPGAKVTDIKIDNFDIAFGDKVLICGASISLVFGRRFGLVGKNGLGKTTLLKMIATGGLKIPQSVSVLHVEQEVIGDDTPAIESVLEADTVRFSLLALEKQLQTDSSQEATSKLAEVYEQLSSMEADKAPAEASMILSGLGFSAEEQKRATKTFSGGWRMRLALARALFAKPDLLLLDEPTNMLDLKAIIWLENHLQSWASTILVVSHDRHFLDEVCTDIFHLHSRSIQHYKGNYRNFVKTRTERLKNQLKEYEAQMLLRQHTQEFIDKFRYNSKRAALVQSRVKMLERLPELKPVEKETEVVFRFPEVAQLNPPIILVSEVVFGYSKDKIVLNKVDLSADMESRICVVGENGAGKTTLLKLVLGELSPINGMVTINRGVKFGYFSQHHVDQLELNVSSVELLQKKFPGSTVEEYRRHLGRFGISNDLALQSINSLSGGQKSRVAFTVMCYPSPNFLILDEPTNHLDVESIEALSTAIRNFKGGVILVSHDERLIRNVCEELWICGNGKVVREDGGFDGYRRAVEEELNCIVYKS